MRLHLTIGAALLTMLPGGAGAAGPAGPTRADRARQTYEALVSGRTPPGQLSPQQRADIAALVRSLGTPRDARTLSRRCVDQELKREGGAPSDLARRVIDMKCLEPDRPLR
ncbi:hypothetical protein [Sphingomonas profundi]|uniref:hypothetical protein n=1 Tax=Alterirhizorhabdus profundi TaxID=2681549 RepID=UPI0012E84D4E|nr:hypothetical protein [Sphingomonas profundi]